MYGHVFPSLPWLSLSVEQELYVLMRLHHVLCQRLGTAVVLAEKAKGLKEDQVSLLVYCFRALVV